MSDNVWSIAESEQPVSWNTEFEPAHSTTGRNWKSFDSPANWSNSIAGNSAVRRPQVVRRDTRTPDLPEQPSQRLRAAVSKQQLDLLNQRQALLAVKKVKSGLVESEKRELDMIRWMIDSNEQAQFEAQSEQFKLLAQTQKNVADQINAFVNFANSQTVKNRR